MTEFEAERAAIDAAHDARVKASEAQRSAERLALEADRRNRLTVAEARKEVLDWITIEEYRNTEVRAFADDVDLLIAAVKREFRRENADRPSQSIAP